MFATSKLVKTLTAIGVNTPPRPIPPFEHIPDHPTEDEIGADKLYQQQCHEWKDAVQEIHRQHFPALHLGSAPDEK